MVYTTPMMNVLGRYTIAHPDIATNQSTSTHVWPSHYNPKSRVFLVKALWNSSCRSELETFAKSRNGKYRLWWGKIALWLADDHNILEDSQVIELLLEILENLVSLEDTKGRGDRRHKLALLDRLRRAYSHTNDMDNLSKTIERIEKLMGLQEFQISDEYTSQETHSSLFGLACSYRHLGKFDEAESWHNQLIYEETFVVVLGHIKVLNNISFGILLQAQGRQDEARELWQQASLMSQELREFSLGEYQFVSFRLLNSLSEGRYEMPCHKCDY